MLYYNNNVDLIDAMDKLDQIKSLLSYHTDFSRETPEANYEIVNAMFHILGLERDNISMPDITDCIQNEFNR